MNRRAFSAFAVVALSCFGCDQLSKEIARIHLDASPAVSLLSGAIELRLAQNPGAFLSLGATLPETVRVAVLQIAAPVLLLGLCFAILRSASTREAIGVALVLGGGAGNWLDRMLNDGTVTDFVRMGFGRASTGIFNLADVAIVLGAAILLLAANSSVARRRAPDVEGVEG